MTIPHRVLLILATVLLAGQTYVAASFYLFFGPLFVGGIMPEEPLSDRDIMTTRIVLISAGVFIVGMSAWFFYALVRSLVLKISIATPLLAACGLQVLIVSRAVSNVWPLAIVLTTGFLAILTTAYVLDRKRLRTPAS
ncbi:hypothetical protein [Streptomyces sp. NPDC003077]|uniref:hypothetical protein n=1 Tax=Streptomyces sp. NPDC003077 TaxID=3154443 RepID=UPI0033B5AC5A